MHSSRIFASFVLSSLTAISLGAAGLDSSPVVTQVPHAMHAPMHDLPVVKVGATQGDLVGADNRALQAAVDYVGALGGGIVEIGPGEYHMRDSLHLRSNVSVRGTPGKTVLRKERAAVSRLKLDGDYGEEQITVEDPAGFAVGDGVAVWDKNANGFHATVARITGASGNTFSISLPLNADCMVENGAQAATVFPVVSGYYVEGAKVQDLVIEGNSTENIPLNGCRGGGIFLYRCPGARIEKCAVRNYNGDGISFQQCNDVTVSGCSSEANTGLGLHPGSGSQRPIVRNCIARNNGQDGLFLCWRVKRGLFEDNLLEGNHGFGISIGHKDTDNLLRNNQVRGNHQDGVFFRNEIEGMAGHRNRLESNVIENNGVGQEAAGIHVRGETCDLIFKANTIRDTRAAAERKQKTGICLEQKVGTVTLDDNKIEADKPMEDQRSGK
jgi:nitrous oxidase accessory protein NosD